MKHSYPFDLIRMTFVFPQNVGFDVFISLEQISGNIKGVARGFRDGQTIIKRETSRDRPEPNDDPPHFIHGQLTDSREPLKPTVTISATFAAANCPKPCMAKTAPIMAPLCFVFANLIG